MRPWVSQREPKKEKLSIPKHSHRLLEGFYWLTWRSGETRWGEPWLHHEMLQITLNAALIASTTGTSANNSQRGIGTHKGLHGRFHSTVPEGSHTGFSIPVGFPGANRLFPNDNEPSWNVCISHFTRQSHVAPLVCSNWVLTNLDRIILQGVLFRLGSAGRDSLPADRTCMFAVAAFWVCFPVHTSQILPKVTCGGGGKIRINCLLGNYG